ncbi:hypothetical protein DFQ27_008849 [Actinomortierella ambigua]|uniref:DUF1682-domain-containing protein n=1 Tax=Actinomortierella ambigua TaxID=1343610 RepID=A0A9P6PRI5_9FUNG|nr:hypothetical protein DFQ27_008849 [Actinomortierella ambigua]
MAAAPVFESFGDFYARFPHEVHFMGVMFVMVIAYVVGKQHNSLLAKTTMGVMLDLFRQNFARIGDGGADLIIDTPNEYIIYLTGRRHVECVHGTIKMRPRQDLLRTIFSLVSGTSDDYVTFNVTMKQNEYSDGVFAVVPKTSGVAIRNRFFDIQRFTKASNHSALDESLIALTESNELSSAILPLVVDKLNESAKWLNYFIVSDQPTHKPEGLTKEPATKRISLSFKLPQRKSMYEIRPLAEALIACLDGLPTKCHVTPIAKGKIAKAREELYAEYEKKEQEKRAKELQERRQREKKEAEASMSASAQRKLAAKEEKRAQMKRQKVVRQ